MITRLFQKKKNCRIENRQVDSCSNYYISYCFRIIRNFEVHSGFHCFSNFYRCLKRNTQFNNKKHRPNHIAYQIRTLYIAQAHTLAKIICIFKILHKKLLPDSHKKSPLNENQMELPNRQKVAIIGDFVNINWNSMNLTDLDFSMLLYTCTVYTGTIQFSTMLNLYLLTIYSNACVPDEKKCGKRQNERGQTNYLCKLNKIRSHFEACFRLIWWEMTNELQINSTNT